MRVDSSEYCFVFIAIISDRNKEMTSPFRAMSLVKLGRHSVTEYFLYLYYIMFSQNAQKFYIFLEKCVKMTEKSQNFV